MFFQAEPFNQFVFLSINPPFVSFYDRFNIPTNFQSWDFYHPLAGQPPGGVQFTYIPRDFDDSLSSGMESGFSA